MGLGRLEVLRTPSLPHPVAFFYLSRAVGLLIDAHDDRLSITRRHPMTVCIAIVQSWVAIGV